MQVAPDPHWLAVQASISAGARSQVHCQTCTALHAIVSMSGICRTFHLSTKCPRHQTSVRGEPQSFTWSARFGTAAPRQVLYQTGHISPTLAPAGLTCAASAFNICHASTTRAGPALLVVAVGSNSRSVVCAFGICRLSHRGDKSGVLAAGVGGVGTGVDVCKQTERWPQSGSSCGNSCP